MSSSSSIFRTATIVSLLAAVAVLSGPAGASAAPKPPVIYEQARAIPTRSGENVRLTLFTRRVSFIKVRVNGEDSVRPSRFGRGCGKTLCQKWKLYSERSEDSECYDLKIYVRNGSGSAVSKMTVCEPFPDGEV